MSRPKCTQITTSLMVALFIATCNSAAWAREEVAKLTPSDVAQGLGDAFGFDVAISGDYIAVGAPEDSQFFQFSGAVYVFKRVGDSWVEQAKLTASDPRFEDFFGEAVDIDGSRIVVGARNADSLTCEYGRAYVFRRSGETWIEEARIDTPGTIDDCFGISVSISGDRIAVGAFEETKDVGISGGRAYVYRHVAADWVLEDTFISSDLALGDGFGVSISIDGALVIVGASDDDDGGDVSGSAYVFRRSGSSWEEEAKLTASDAGPGHRFGLPVSLNGNAAAVGARNSNGGAAYVFKRSNGTWVQEARLAAPDPLKLDDFGGNVAMDGDLALVSAHRDDEAGTDVGAVYLFGRDNKTWSIVDKLFASDNTHGFGISVASDGADAVGGRRGAAYVFWLPEAIPAVSEWGVIVMALLLLIAGTLLLRNVRRSVQVALFVLPITILFMGTRSASAQQADFALPHDAEHLLVRFKPGTGEDARTQVHAVVGGVEQKRFRNFEGLVVVKVSAAQLQQAWAAYVGNPTVLYAEPDYAITFDGPCDACDPAAPKCPDDTYFTDLWGLHNIGQMIAGQEINGDPFTDPGTCNADSDVLEAWDLWSGDAAFKIAVVDTGVDYNHEDLAGNMWTNPNEQVGDANSDGCPGLCGVDDDGDGQVDECPNLPLPEGAQCSWDDDENGWVDDIHGYDFGLNESDPAPNTEEGNPFHGTHVAGTIGAVADNATGVVGVNWQCNIVALKVSKPFQNALARISAAIGALDYIVTNDIKVSNHSWGVGGWSQSLYDAVEQTQSIGHILIASAGNKSKSVEIPKPTGDPHYPCGFALPNVICVANTDNDDNLNSGSNYGPTSVDLGAPGTHVFSAGNESDCDPLPCGYKFRSGTSMSAPHTTGVVALIRSLYSESQMPWEGVRYKTLFTGRTPIPVPNPLEGKTVTGDVVNALSVLDCNANGVLDDLDISGLTSQDCNSNLIPDECEPNDDCNTNSVRDMCDIGGGTSQDCNGNAVPDECDALETDADICNNNGIPDECEFSTPISGACCMTDDLCEDRTLYSCQNAGGTIVACDQSCPFSYRIGACCLPGTTCKPMEQICCESAGGTYKGDLVSCGSDEPNDPYGACCLPNGNCIETFESCCDAEGGMFASQFCCGGCFPVVFCGPP